MSKPSKEVQQTPQAPVHSGATLHERVVEAADAAERHARGGAQ